MNLTKRETEIADLMSWGCSVSEAADRLEISTSTVSNTLRNIYRKLGFNKVSELCAYVFCTKYGVDVGLDKIGNVRRAIVASSLLLLFLTHVFILPDDEIRLRRTRGRRQEQQEQQILI